MFFIMPKIVKKHKKVEFEFPDYHMKTRDEQGNLSISFDYLRLKTLQKIIFDSLCRFPEKVSETGSWCLYPDEEKEIVKGYPLAKYHIPADTGIGETILEFISEESRIVDVGCGIGQYGH